MEFNADIFWKIFTWGSACGISFLIGQFLKQVEMEGTVVGIWKILKIKIEDKERGFKNKEFIRGAKFFATTYLMNSSKKNPQTKLEQDHEYYKIISMLDENNIFDEYIKKKIRKPYEDDKEL